MCHVRSVITGGWSVVKGEWSFRRLAVRGVVFLMAVMTQVKDCSLKAVIT